MSDPRGIIAAVRDGRGLDEAGAIMIARGLTDGSLSDAQAGAFAMAVLLSGIGSAGRVALTLAMRDSGDVMAWDLPGPAVDKHSTGGIGDTVSLILAPALAACGAYVPMVSGRGLGHTGGTLDKLEAIPGYRTDVSENEFRRVVREVGCAIVSASGDLAPADRRLYAIRDESAAVESLDLITASILSKKLAAGLDALVLDVKSGSGAFLRGADQADELARALVGTANGAGCRSSALITDMDQPLGREAGNALEVRAAIRVLRGEGGALADLSVALAAECLDLAGLEGGAAAIADAIGSGRAAETFGRMVAELGGPADLLDRPDRYFDTAPVMCAIPASKGFVSAIDGTAIGHAAVTLGAGRVHAGEKLDMRVGFSDLRRLGEEVGPGQPLGFVHAANQNAADAAIAAVQAAYSIADTAPAPGPLVRERIVP